MPNPSTPDARAGRETPAIRKCAACGRLTAPAENSCAYCKAPLSPPDDGGGDENPLSAAERKAINSGDRVVMLLRQRVQTLEAEVKSYEESDEAMEAKLESLAPHGTCGCSYDAPGDVCLHHSPQLAKVAQRVKTLEEALRAVEENSFPATRGSGNVVEWDGFTWRCDRKTSDLITRALEEPTP